MTITAKVSATFPSFLTVTFIWTKSPTTTIRAVLPGKTILALMDISFTATSWTIVDATQ
jgi:hypothetical protein